ncbi:MAG: GntR family transcriptional regulator [Mesorhizobium sp.]|nr:GntR family transcriptional regulator [Mesorhizobium sp. M5C.F.Cr.IN.023.01.1.1]RWC98822.1 MAG: GntR family transcriptional regulator [Mesorhizobium sp.]
MTRREFSELTAMRLQLEPLALTLAAPHLKPAQFERLDAFVAQHEAARLASDPTGVRHADTGFLFELYRSSGSALLLSFIENLWLRRSPMLWEARWALLGSSLGRAHHLLKKGTRHRTAAVIHCFGRDSEMTSARRRRSNWRTVQIL